MISMDWDGMTADEEEDNRVWREDVIEKSHYPNAGWERFAGERRRVSTQTDEWKRSCRRRLDNRRRGCCGGCGVKDCNKVLQRV